MKMNKMEITNLIGRYLKEFDCNFNYIKEIDTFNLGLALQSKMKTVDVFIHVCDDEYVVYGLLPIGADASDKKMMASMSEFICRVNYGLKNGCFELDMDDGEIKYRTYVDCEESIPSIEVVRNSILCLAAMVEKYSEGILDIVFGNVSAKTAAQKCEDFDYLSMQRKFDEMINKGIDAVSSSAKGESDDMEDDLDVDVDYIINEIFKAGGGIEKPKQ